ncbi:MAG: hypothetical protein IJ864_02510 [Alphaproteobacteria bacterium]|nr:hypothetical protein [Alphaproteobacteria bacterium]
MKNKHKNKYISILLILCALFPLSTTAEEGQLITTPAQEENLLENKIYFFAHSMCQSCKDAYIYLYQYHADLQIPITDMKFHHNFELYKQCVKKFGIANTELRLPLICMGNHYIMGWDETSGNRFEEYLNYFKK